MEAIGFDALPLHDAVLRSIEVDWEKKRCVLRLSAFVTPNREAAPHALAFEGVTLLTVPHDEPWGQSSFVNSACTVADGFRIEMQSGDVIELRATNFAFSAL